MARGNHADSQKTHLRSSQQMDKDAAAALDGLDDDDDDQSARSKMNLERDGLFLRHLGALFKKRAANFKRDKRAWLCTTILPTLFVLIGFLVFKFASPQRDLDPITLDLSSFNRGVSKEPINPLPFNSANINPYTCQPGRCAYTVPEGKINIPNTSEAYTFCGAQVDLGGSLAYCSISKSEDIISTLDGFQDITPVETDVMNIQNVSLLCS